MGDEIIGQIQSDEITTHPGRYTSTDGFLSADKKLQDGFYYQEYSYEISSSKSLTEFKDPMMELVHPSGTKLFSKVNISQTIETDQDFSVEWNYDTTQDFEYTANTQALFGNTDFLIVYKPIIDIAEKISFLNTTTESGVYTGEASVFQDTNLTLFRTIPVNQYAALPVQYLGTKRVLWGDPIFADGSPVNTAFPSSFGVGATVTFDNSNYYTISRVYSDTYALLTTSSYRLTFLVILFTEDLELTSLT